MEENVGKQHCCHSGGPAESRASLRFGGVPGQWLQVRRPAGEAKIGTARVRYGTEAKEEELKEGAYAGAGAGVAHC